jgi:hypothetical protein
MIQQIWRFDPPGKAQLVAEGRISGSCNFISPDGTKVFYHEQLYKNAPHSTVVFDANSGKRLVWAEDAPGRAFDAAVKTFGQAIGWTSDSSRVITKVEQVLDDGPVLRKFEVVSLDGGTVFASLGIADGKLCLGSPNFNGNHFGQIACPPEPCLAPYWR